MKNSLAVKGLSMSQAQSISNLCNQRSRDIASQLGCINNASKNINISGETYTETKGIAVPSNVVELLKEKSRLHATQAFLMENIKAKERMVREIQSKDFEFSVEPPKKPTKFSKEMPSPLGEEWALHPLTKDEYNEYLEAEAYASHIGQFIHKGGKLDKLRTELPTIKTLEFIEIETGKKTPIKINVHHTSEELLTLHEELAAIHRGYEQKVNYFKSKVKNLVTTENARISKERANIQAEINELNSNQDLEYKNALEKYNSEYKKLSQDFETKRQEEIKFAANLKIEVAERFQPVVDEFLKQLK